MPEINADQLNNALSALNGAIPVALFPVKVQTRFATQSMVDALGNGSVPAPDPAAAPAELWVRIYPDDIFVHTHEDQLTEDELVAAGDYWAFLWAAAGQAGREDQKAGAWRALSEDFGPVRARYILRETHPIGGLDAEGFPQSAPQLPDLATTEESWSNAPRTYLLPDRFVVSIEKAGAHRHYEGALIDKTEDGALRLGLDPGSPDEFEDTPEGRQVPEDLKWMTDFPKAVEVGMALRIPLGSWGAEDQIDRLTVLGWKGGAAPSEGMDVLNRLLENHRYKVGGMDLVGVGTPTNNTREADASLSPENRDSDKPEPDTSTGNDAEQLAQALGLPADTFAGLDNSNLSSIADARKVNELLFDITLGQALEFWQPSLSTATRSQLKQHFVSWVSGRGHLPALQIDDQPYGILPALSWSALNSNHAHPEGSLLRQLWDHILWPLHSWYSTQLDEVAHIERGISPRQAQLQLLSVLQLHPTSVAYRQRFALRPEVAGDEALRNLFLIPEGEARADREGDSISAQLSANGLPGVDNAEKLLFETQARPLLWEAGDDDRLIEATDEDPLLGMEGGVIPPLPDSDQNYLQWLAEHGPDAAPPGSAPPRAILYHLLKRRLQLPSSSQPGAASPQALLNEIKDWPAPYLRRMVQEHLDCCTYRLDAWLSSYAAFRLQEIRQENAEGIYIGAWGYLEHLKPEQRPVQPEYIPAPSLRHATTAAVLRSGYQNNRSSGTGENLFAVGLSSGRVKNALFLLEGVRNGQDLSALLGYRLERAMQEFRNSGVPTLAPFIQDLREKYRFEVIPVVGENQGSAPDTEEDFSQRVIDAVALVEDETEGWRSEVSAAVEEDLEDIIAGLAEQLDSVKDLLAAEGVYQLVDGQVDRAKAALDAMTDGEQLTRPEIVDQPRSSLPLTFRMGVLLQDRPLPVTGGAPLSPRAVVSPKLNRWLLDQLPDLSFIKVRVRWQSGVDGSGNPVFEALTMPLRHLQIEPIDLVYMMHLQRENPDTSELRYRIERVVRQQRDLPLTTRIQILEEDRTGFDPSDYTLFAVEPLAAGLGKLLMETRSLRPEDFLRANDESVEAAGQLWEPEFLRRQLRNVALEWEDMDATLANALDTAQELANGLSGNGTHPQLEQRLRSIREDTFFYAGLGWVKAVPPAIDRLDKLTLEQEIRRCRNILEDAQSRMVQAREVWQEGSPQLLSTLLQQPPAGQDAAGEVALLETIIELLFGRFYRVCPDFRLPASTQLQQSMADPQLKNSADDFAIERWLQTQAPLRPKIDLYYRCNMLTELFGGTKEGDGMSLLQLPLREGKPGPWVGQEYGSFIPHGDTMAMTLELQEDFSFSNGTFSGLLIDDWQELIPDPEVNAGIALQYDQPDTEPPNAVLLAMTPRRGAAWDWPVLQNTVLDNLHLAKLRGVDPDILKNSFLDQFLPLVLGEVTITEEGGERSYGGLLFGAPPGEQRIVEAPPTEVTDDDLAGLDLGNTIE